MLLCSLAVVVAIGIDALGYREVLGIAVRDSEAEGFWRQFLSSLKERGLAGCHPAGDLIHLPGPDGGDQADVPGLQLASHREVRCIAQLVPGALPAQPALPRPEGWPGHGGSGHESGARDGGRP